METLQLRREFAISDHGLALIQQLSAELDARYGPIGEPSFSPEDIRGVPGAVFVVASLGDRPVGCGALRPIDSGVAEVKRMYVDPAARGQRIARAILGELERFAGEYGYHSVRLETGDRQPEAVRVYEQMGYARIPCYGAYSGNPWSLCFEKLITRSEQAAS